jgi:hypothetical protein
VKPLLFGLSDYPYLRNHQIKQAEMVMSYIALSMEDIQSLSSAARREVLNIFGHNDHYDDDDDDEAGGELTRKQVVEFLAGLSDKSKNVLRTMVIDFDTNHVAHKDLLDTLDMVGENLTGVWAGITKRSRTVSGDPEFSLIEWTPNDDGDDNIGRFNANTYNHLKKIFT